jgi:uncharacterized OB-fold protein
MTPPDNEQTNTESSDPKDEKTVILQRCPKHGTLYMPNEGCPECEKEKSTSAG